MHSSAELLLEIESILPPVSKPSGSNLSFHPTECMQCEFLRNDLKEYDGQVLPERAIRWLRGELTLLSAQGWRWVMPSYLKHCVTQDPNYDPMETEFLIYSLGPDQEHEEDAVKRLADFTQAQLQLLSHFLEWCAEHPHWSVYCPDDVAKAQSFMAKLMQSRGAA
jgi:hypothetical protein